MHGAIAWIVSIAVLLIIALAVIAIWYDGARRKRRDAENLKLLESAEAGDVDARNEVLSSTARWIGCSKSIHDRVQALAQLRSAEMRWEEHGTNVLAYRDWAKQENIPDRIEQLADLAYYYSRSPRDVQRRLEGELGYSLTATKNLLHSTISNYYKDLTKTFYKDKDAFINLRWLVHSTRSKNSPIRRFGCRNLDFPDGWEDLMVKRIALPELADFNVHNWPTEHRMGLMAVKALQYGDPVEIKRLLALANYKPIYRFDLGEVLYAQVLERVVMFNDRLREKDLIEA